MSFICNRCNKATPNGAKVHRIVTEKREVTYPYRNDANRYKDAHGWVWTDDKGGKGYETAKELSVCGACLA